MIDFDLGIPGDLGLGVVPTSDAFAVGEEAQHLADRGHEEVGDVVGVVPHKVNRVQAVAMGQSQTCVCSELRRCISAVTAKFPANLSWARLEVGQHARHLCQYSTRKLGTCCGLPSGLMARSIRSKSKATDRRSRHSVRGPVREAGPRVSSGKKNIPHVAALLYLADDP